MYKTNNCPQCYKEKEPSHETDVFPSVWTKLGIVDEGSGKCSVHAHEEFEPDV